MLQRWEQLFMKATTGKQSIDKNIFDDDIARLTSTTDSSLNHSLLHTPNPHPGRGIYGFALYLFSWILLLIYLLWAFLPQKLLASFHLTYLPSKYWAIAVPLLVPVIIGLLCFIVFVVITTVKLAIMYETNFFCC